MTRVEAFSDAPRGGARRSLADVRRTFNERVIASEWIRSKVKVNEDVSPDELIEYYRAHLADERALEAMVRPPPRHIMW